MALGAIMAGAGVAGAGLNYLGAKEQADAQKQSAQQANAPFRAKEPYLDTLYRGGERAYQQAQDVGTPEAMQQGWQQQEGVAQNLQQQGYGQNVQQFGQDLLSGRYLDPSSNQQLQGAMDAATRPVEQQFSRETMPQLAGGAQDAGQYGGSRQGVLEANALNDLTRNILDTRSQMAYQNYSDERQRQMQAPEMMQQGTQMQLTPGALQQEVGQQQYQQEMNQVGAGLDQLAGTLGVGPNQQTAAQPGPSPIQNAVAGGLGGASTAAGIMQALGSGGGGNAPTQGGAPGFGSNTSWYTGMGS